MRSIENRMRGTYRAVLVSFVCGIASCAPGAPGVPPVTLDVKSTSFASGGVLPVSSTCDGSNVSPPLAWRTSPPNTRSFALVVTDRDSPLQFLLGPFVHWIAYDIPPETRQLQANVQSLHEGTNSFDKAEFGGPCPPGNASHRYAFTLYALDTKIGLPQGVNLKTLYAALQGHVLAEGTLVGRYH